MRFLKYLFLQARHKDVSKVRDKFRSSCCPEDLMVNISPTQNSYVLALCFIVYKDFALILIGLHVYQGNTA